MKNKIKKFQNPPGPLDYKKQMSVIKYDENGLPYTELLSTEVTPRKNITDYSQVQDMRPTNDTEQERRLYTAQNARKRRAALPYVGAALSLPLLLGGAAPAIASEAFVPTVGKALEYGMKAMLPSTYITNAFGNGYKAQYAANLADGLLNSAVTAEVANRFRLNPNLRNSAELGVLAMPLGLPTISRSVRSMLNTARRSIHNDNRVVYNLDNIRNRLRLITGRELELHEIEDIITNAEANLYKVRNNGVTTGLRATPEDWQTLENYANRRYRLVNRQFTEEEFNDRFNSLLDRLERLYGRRLSSEEIDHILDDAGVIIDPWSSIGRTLDFLRIDDYLNSHTPLLTLKINPGEQGYKLEDLIDPTTGELKHNLFESFTTGARGIGNFHRTSFSDKDNVKGYLRTVFGGDQGAIGREIVGDNNYFNKSGVTFNSHDYDLSIDSFESALKYLRLMLGQGRKYYRYPSSVGRYYEANDLGQKNRYFKLFDKEFEKLLYANKGELPDGVTMRPLDYSSNVGMEFVGLDGRVLGTLKTKTNKEIIDYYKKVIDKLNARPDFQKNGIKIDYPVIRNDEIYWPNLDGVFYKNGGRIKINNNVYNNKRTIKCSI